MINHQFIQAQEKVIVYRSKMEQLQDEFWADMLTNNPEFFVWAFVIGIIAFAAFLIRPYFRRNRW